MKYGVNGFLCLWLIEERVGFVGVVLLVLLLDYVVFDILFKMFLFLVSF